MKDEYFTIDEVATSLRVTVRTIKRMIKAKKIKALNVSAGEGKRPTWRFLQGDIDRFISENYHNFDKE